MTHFKLSMSTSLDPLADNASSAEDGDEFDLYTAQNEPPHKPHAFWLGCCDARVPQPAGLGQLFVHRNIANQFLEDDSNVQAALYYAVHVLHVNRVIVVGHTFCGGVNASLHASKRPHGRTDKLLLATHPINRWLEPLTTFVRYLRTLPRFPSDDRVALTDVVTRNVWKQVDELCDSAFIQEIWSGQNGDLVVEGQVYDIENEQSRTIYRRPARSQRAPPPPFS